MKQEEQKHRPSSFRIAKKNTHGVVVIGSHCSSHRYGEGSLFKETRRKVLISRCVSCQCQYQQINEQKINYFLFQEEVASRVDRKDSVSFPFFCSAFVEKTNVH